MKKTLVILTLLLLSFMKVDARTLKEPEALFNDKHYLEAYGMYETLMALDTRDYRLKYKAARCLIAVGRYDEAIPLLEYAVKKKMYKAHYYLYEAYYALYRFDMAEAAIDAYMAEVELSDEAKTISLRLKEQARQAGRMLDAVDYIAVVDSTLLPKARLLDAYSLPETLGSVFYVANDSARQMAGYQTGRGDKRIVTAERNGRLALAVAYKLMDKWGQSAFLSDNINTDADVNYPFELPDGITLYFSSNGNGSIGGYDIFMSRFGTASNDYTEPLNIGMPYNSPSNDYMLVLDDLDNRGWFATDRRQHPDTVVVYEFIPNAQRRTLDTADADYRRSVAMMLDYRRNDVPSERTVTAEGRRTAATAERQIDFRVDDNTVYTSVEQFVNDEARKLYLELEDQRKRGNTLAILLEGKRREYLFSSSDADKVSLREEVLSLEKDIAALNVTIKDTIRRIRVLETQK